VFTIRFDMRAPSFGAPTSELYAAAIDMCAWAESRGAIVAVLSEHHGTEDGHLPSPLMLASAIAARTQRLPIMLAAVVLPFCDPVRLAEDMSVLDIISNGRVSYAFGIGHRREEYEHFGVDMRRRGRLAEEKLTLLRRLLAGESVCHDGRRIHVTPACTTPGGPLFMLAGGSAAAVERAARHGLGIVLQTNSGGLKERYERECRAAGHQPGFVQLPDESAPTAVFVAGDADGDVDKAWRELGPHLLHDAVTAASYRHGDMDVASISRATDVAGLRAPDSPYRVFTVEQAANYMRSGKALPLAPLCGGLAPEVAWPYLERAVEAVARAGSAKEK
jgi:alkanesulfonate monooxygenase SsuD/methylene tetrahydromethanopterin reductase-like flavin-dependent oxidoreductase (luciferase family)